MKVRRTVPVTSSSRSVLRRPLWRWASGRFEFRTMDKQPYWDMDRLD